ncbi:cyclic nucleotide-gated cation channel beta-3-like isoform X2 [Mya arenaria]|uniref:cyclic nucleotide-gated cation channel beta-3-like isoform X2 n=1 Tax=Mya arenaria TaxID=6604 RepID=UPI0022DEEA78|nr:cyclic nucleotide-gated cation channel beta-3-like isoform X2 [Mya arenaria]
MIWTTLMKAFWRNEPKRREYRSVSLAPPWQLDDSSDDDDYDDVIQLEILNHDATRPLLEIRETDVDHELRHADGVDNGTLRPGFLDGGDAHLPPPSPGVLSTASAWSDLLNIAPSRKSSDAGLSVVSRMSNVSSSLSEQLRHLVRAFSSRTEKVKETTLQPPSPSSLSDYAGSDAMSAISTELQFRHRLDSFFPDQAEGDTISEIVRFREELEIEKTKIYKLPRWIRKLRFPHVIEPQSKLYLFWLFIVTLAFMYNAWVIPLRAAFPYQTSGNVMYWLVADYTCDLVYIVDILLFKMRISFLNSGLKETHRSKTRANYFQKRIFKFDVASLLPLDLLYLIEMKVNPWCRLPRLLKIQTFWEFYSRCDHLVRSAHAVRIVKTFTYMLFLIHVETCGYYSISVYEGFNANRWVYDGTGNAYIRCFYLATKTATSIGNNPKPTNTLEFSFMTIYWGSGVFVFALLIGQIRDIVDAANMVTTTYTQRMDAALQYVKNMNLPHETQDRVRTWFIYNWQQQKVIDERQMMDALPMKLRKDLAIHVHFNTLSKVKLFSDCDKTLLYDLVLKLQPILYLPGDYVCRKGEIGKEMYIVSQGIVEVVGGPNNTLVLATLREGSVFGEISLLAMAAEGNRRTADVRCKGYTNLFILSKADFEAAMKDYPDAHKLLKKRAKKLLRMNARIERQSQCSMDNTKISATDIIRAQPETPKLVKTVLQVMNPESTLVRKLSDRRRTPEGGADNDSVHKADSKGNTRHHSPKPEVGKRTTPETREEVEVFYDDFLSTKDWSGIIIDSEEDRPGFAGNGDANDSQSDTKKDSKESFPELVKFQEIYENDEERPTLDGFNYSLPGSAAASESLCPTPYSREDTSVTADMFGDIESCTHNKQTQGSARSQRQTNREPGSGRKSCLSKSLREDEYAHSLANGFTIIIDSVDDDDIDADFDIIDDKDDTPVENSASIETVDEVKVAKSVTFQDQNETGNKEAVTVETNQQHEHVKVEVTSEQQSNHKPNMHKSGASVYISNSKKIAIKPPPGGKAKPVKNKLGLKLKLDSDKVGPISPYSQKSQSTKGKSHTNRAREHRNCPDKELLPNGNVTEERPNITQTPSTEICANKGPEEIPMAFSKDKQDKGIVNVASAPEENRVNNSRAEMQPESSGQESVPSPTQEVEDPGCLSPESVTRQRKISVISIGSVLKDGRETLV